MAFTTADLTAIETAIATGEWRVEIDGKLVIYRHMDELLKARDTIRADLEASGATASTVRTSFVQRSRD